MTRPALPLNAFHTFVITARHLNLTRAASELCLTQSAVSRKIAALEAWLGFSVFERHARGLRLTERGAQLLPEVTRGIEQILRAAEQAGRTEGAIRLRAPTCVLRWLLPRLLQLELEQPDVHISLTTTREHCQQREAFDAAIIYGPPCDDGVMLFAERLIPVVSPELLSGQLTPDALSRLTFLHPARDRRDWQRWLSASGLQPDIARHQHFDTMDLAIGAALQGFGITVADPHLVAEDLAAGRLVAPFNQQVETGAVYTLLRRPDGRGLTPLTALTRRLTDV